MVETGEQVVSEESYHVPRVWVSSKRGDPCNLLHTSVKNNSVKPPYDDSRSLNLGLYDDL